MDHSEDVVGSARPPKPAKPPRPRDPERTKRVLLQVIAVATVATGVCAGLTAWETHAQRVQNEDLYCANYSYDWESGDLAKYDDLDGSAQAIVDLLDCEVADD